MCNLIQPRRWGWDEINWLTIADCLSLKHRKFCSLMVTIYSLSLYENFSSNPPHLLWNFLAIFHSFFCAIHNFIFLHPSAKTLYFALNELKIVFAFQQRVDVRKMFKIIFITFTFYAILFLSENSFVFGCCFKKYENLSQGMKT